MKQVLDISVKPNGYQCEFKNFVVVGVDIDLETAKVKFFGSGVLKCRKRANFGINFV